MYASCNLQRLERIPRGKGDLLANFGNLVFRAAHDCSKAMRAWMGEMNKK